MKVEIILRQSMQAGQEAYGQQGCPELCVLWPKKSGCAGGQEQMNKWGLVGWEAGAIEEWHTDA